MLGIEAFLLALLWCSLILYLLKLKWSNSSYPPGPLRLPVIGNVWRMKMKLSEETLIKLAKQYGNIYTIWLGPVPFVVLSGFEAVKEGLINHSAHFSGRIVTPFIKATTGEQGIIFSNGHTWKQHRKFGIATLQNLGMVKKTVEHQIQEEAQKLVETFASAKGQPFDPSKRITNSVCNVICAMVFGRRFSVEDQEFLMLTGASQCFLQFIGTIFYYLYEAFPWIVEHLPGPHKKIVQYKRYMDAFTKKEVERHKNHQAMHEPQDYIDFYLLQMERSKNDPSSTFNEENLVECIIDLFVAGTDTTSLTMQWGLLLLTNHPDIQEKVHKEIDDVLGSSQFFSYQNLKRMPYTNAVIHEIQRFKFIETFGVPRACVKDVNILGINIPKGVTVISDLHSVLLDPKKWEKPQEFYPNHFLDKDGNFMEREAFIPFGAGARVCLGEQLARIELFTLFTSLLRTFTFQLPEGVKELSEEPIVKSITFPKPYKLRAVPRLT